MKSLYLIKKRLKQYFTKNKTIFIIFIIGGLLNASVFAYMYGNLKPKIAAKSLTSFEYRRYNVYYNVTVDERGNVKILEPERRYILDKNVDKLIDTGLFESVMTSYQPAMQMRYDTEHRVFAVGTINLGTFNLSKIRGVLKLASDDMVLIGNNDVDVGDSISLLGKLFTVAGIYVGSDTDVIVTTSVFESLELPVNCIQCISKENWHLGQTEGDVPYNTLQELFPDAYVEYSGESVIANDKRIGRLGVETTVVTYVVSAIAFVFLLVFMTGSISDENASSIISGAGPARITAQVFLEGWVLSAISVFLGLAVHAFLYPSLFSRINISEGVYYTFGDYAAMACIMLVINAIVLAIVSARYIMLTPVELRRKAS